jgi:RNA polymerase sigma-70 factor (ECF subfamily)
MESSDAAVQTIEQIYHRYYQPVLRHLERLVQQHESAEDLCQETFLKAFRHWEQFGEMACVGCWLYRVATNSAYDFLRRQRRNSFMALLEEAAWVAAPIESRWDDAEPVRGALRQVPAHFRIPLMLQIIDGYSLDDIATMLGCLPATVKTRVHRARKHFRQHYATLMCERV